MKGITKKREVYSMYVDPNACVERINEIKQYVEEGRSIGYINKALSELAEVMSNSKYVDLKSLAKLQNEVSKRHKGSLDQIRYDTREELLLELKMAFE